MQPETPLYTTDTTKWDRYVEDCNELVMRFPYRAGLPRSAVYYREMMQPDTKVYVTNWPSVRAVIFPSDAAKKWFIEILRGELGADWDRFPKTYDEWVEKGRPWEATPLRQPVAA